LSPESHDWYKLHPGVKRIALNLYHDSRHLGEAIWNNIRRVVRVRRAIVRSRPHVVISFTDIMNVLTLIACTGLKVPVIVSERTEPRHHSIGLMWRGLRALCYPMASAIVIQTEALRGWATKWHRWKAVHVIPNPVQPNLGKVLKSSTAAQAERKVLALGRLGREKGYDLLVEAFGRCVRQHPNWVLVIVGEGEERDNLQAQALRLGVQERVRLIGRVLDPKPFLREADLFVLSSRYEGFPNALLEAMACGLPVIAADCPNGPREIIEHGINGLLAQRENVASLTEAMNRLMGNPSERERLGSGALDVRHRFGVDTIMRQWEGLIAPTCGGSLVHDCPSALHGNESRERLA
jgi:glycosyltransferase involved in cell wall biosynthesis